MYSVRNDRSGLMRKWTNVGMKVGAACALGCVCARSVYSSVTEMVTQIVSLVLKHDVGFQRLPTPSAWHTHTHTQHLTQSVPAWSWCEKAPSAAHETSVKGSESVGITEAWSIIIVTVCFMCKRSYLFTKITFSLPEKIWFPHKGSQTRRSDADFLVLSPDRFSCKARVVGDVITMGVWLTDLWYMLNDR